MFSQFNIFMYDFIQTFNLKVKRDQSHIYDSYLAFAKVYINK